MTSFLLHAEPLGPHRDSDRGTWLSARRAGIGASDMANIMGLGRKHEDGTAWTSAYAVYADKVGPEVGDDDGSEVAHWGNLFEPLLVAEYARRAGTESAPGGELLRSRTHAHLLATLDAELAPASSSPGVCEVKTTGQGYRWREGVPVDVQIQIQHQLLVTGAEWGVVVWLPFPERRLQWVEVRPHAEFRDVMLDAARDFWRLVESRTPPPVDGSDSTQAALARLYPETDGSTLALGPEWARAVDEFASVKAQLKELEIQEKNIKAMLHDAMGAAAYATLPDGRQVNGTWTKGSVSHCPSCAAVTGTRKGYRQARVSLPRKARM